MTRRQRFRRAQAALLLALAAAAPGCAQVAPWERGNLAKPHMALTPSPMQSTLRGHQYGSREASSGGGGAGGGGCGCY
jgi:hypothetical protein